MIISIKNMVCGRCIVAVKQELLRIGLHPIAVELGTVRIEEEDLSATAKASLAASLKQLGFELLDTNKFKVLERIKGLIIDIIHHQERFDLKVNWSDFIAQELHQDYNSLSTLFSSVEGTTIEHYIINQKVEKAKELITYDEKNLSEISFLLGYSSVQHFSTQFKKVTGLTPSQFKNLRNPQLRKPLDSI